MAKIVRLIILIVVAFVAYDYGWPWLQAELAQKGKIKTTVLSDFDGDDVMDSGVDRCLLLASDANEAFGAGIGQFSGGQPNRGDWMSFAGRVQKQAARAASACSCPGDGCGLAAEAMVELESLIQETDGLVRGSTDTFSNPANRHEKVYDLLARARRAADNEPNL
ncbi:MAG: hypothetical protein K8J08_01960 [Thermoanaerobaculia bacterium]|nr:hypothetical protein [Thermoanaerobaculia bacterium]